MKNHAALLQIVCFWLVISMLGPVGQVMAAQNCTDRDGFSVACSNEMPTRLDLIEECTDIDGLPTTCRHQQAVRLDLVEACTDHEGFAVSCDKTQRSTAQSGPVLTAQSSL